MYILPRVTTQITKKIEGIVKSSTTESGSGTTSYHTSKGYDFGAICYSMGGGIVSTWSSISYSWTEYTSNNETYRDFSWTASMTAYYSDSFQDPLDIGLELGNAYGYGHTWTGINLNGSGSVKE
jgi:hypothetical protein